MKYLILIFTYLISFSVFSQASTATENATPQVEEVNERVKSATGGLSSLVDIDNATKEATKTYNACIKEGKTKAECRKLAQEKCANKDGQSQGDCTVIADTLLMGDNDINLDIVEETLLATGGSSSNNIYEKIKFPNGFSAKYCLKVLNGGIETYVTDKLVSTIDELSSSSSSYIVRNNAKALDSINQCSDILGHGFMISEGSVEPNVEKACRYFFSSPSALQTLLNNKTNLLTDYGQTCVNADPEGKKTCQQKYEGFVSNLVEGNSADTNATMYTTRLLSGCVGLKSVSSAIKKSIKEQGYESAGQSMDKSITCTAKADRSSPYALDFPACMQAITWYDANVVVSNYITPTVTSTMETIESVDIASDQTSAYTNGDSVDQQTAALVAQKETYEMQANSQITSATASGGMAVMLFTKFASFPSRKVVSEDWCGGAGNEFNLSQEEVCGAVLMAAGDEDVDSALFYNSRAKTVLMYAGATELSKAITSGIVAAAYLKQADLVNTVVEEIEDAEYNQEENQLTDEEVYCLQNPAAETCSNLAEAITAGVTGYDVNFGTTSGVNADALSGSSGIDDSTTSGSNSAIATTDTPTEITDMTATDSDSKADDEFRKIAAAGVKAGSSGGGGGGGGGSAGGGGGGGGSVPEASGNNGSTASTGDAKTYGSYSSGGTGSFSGASSISKSKKSTNPFAALVGKSSRGVASEIEKSILPKEIKLFEAISSRYAKVSENNQIQAREGDTE